jgi:hypothetical protein
VPLVFKALLFAFPIPYYNSLHGPSFIAFAVRVYAISFRGPPRLLFLACANPNSYEPSSDEHPAPSNGDS